MKLIVGISGASGVIMGYRLMQILRSMDDIETHLVMSDSAAKNFDYEVGLDINKVIELADNYHDVRNMAATISSGSFRTDGMIVLPCSMKSLAAIAMGMDLNLLIRAANVCLKEERRVVLVPREMPLGRAHLKNMLTANENGCIILPPMLTFYNMSLTSEQQIVHVIGKILMQFGLDLPQFLPWEGIGTPTNIIIDEENGQ